MSKPEQEAIREISNQVNTTPSPASMLDRLRNLDLDAYRREDDNEEDSESADIKQSEEANHTVLASAAPARFSSYISYRAESPEAYLREMRQEAAGVDRDKKDDRNIEESPEAYRSEIIKEAGGADPDNDDDRDSEVSSVDSSRSSTPKASR